MISGQHIIDYNNIYKFPSINSLESDYTVHHSPLYIVTRQYCLDFPSRMVETLFIFRCGNVSLHQQDDVPIFIAPRDGVVHLTPALIISGNPGAPL